MSATLRCLFCFGLGLTIFGCSGGQQTGESNEETAPSPASSNWSDACQIAVIDINEVARQIGAMDKINASMGRMESELNGQLATYQETLDKRLEEEKQKFDTDLNERQQGELDALLASRQRSLQQQTQLAGSQLAAHHNQLKLKLLNEIRPIAFEVARKRGMNLVVTTQQVYAARPEADITAEVVERIKQVNAHSDSREQSAPATRVAELPGGGAFKPY